MPAGRPTLYRDDHPDRVFKLALLGVDDQDIAHIFGISVDTFYEWCKVHPEFSEARARGKEPADADVAVSLYQRAKGYSHDAVKIMQFNGEPVIVPYVEHYPPDTQAATWWLKNRHASKWRDKTEVEHGISDDLANAIADSRKRSE